MTDPSPKRKPNPDRSGLEAIDRIRRARAVHSPYWRTVQGGLYEVEIVRDSDGSYYPILHPVKKRRWWLGRLLPDWGRGQ